MNIPSPEELIADAHQQWLQHPITQMLLRNIDKHKNTLIKSGVDHASDYGTHDVHFRNMFSNVKSVDAIRAMILNFETFNNLNKKP